MADGRSDLGLKLLKKKILKDRGFDCSTYKESFLRRRVEIRLRATGAQSYGEYMRVLSKTPQEYNKLLDTLAVNVTRFFRDGEVFNFFAEEVLPELILRKRELGSKMIRVWSAGCSTGEEAYSIAILFYEYLGSDMRDFILSIYGTDVDGEAIKKAKSGVFASSKFIDMKKEYIDKYFVYESGGEARVKDIIKKFVKFRQHDLMSDERLSHFDAIFCRNVLIYLDREKQKDLLKRFYDALNFGGYLILGGSETLVDGTTGLFETISLENRVYRKRASPTQ
ncbi:MAG: CheR family methyltransferase [Candidatus Hydrothermarchaeales archaeon]